MAATNEEIARDIVIANISAQTAILANATLTEMYKTVLKAVGEASRAEADAHSVHYNRR
ncbi:hypothetical protein [Luteimonas fraxinea]|uniref:Uncharacterized protein n=1 Tax=Luteimonas fraxinea TaxID=2901869 RepID=A0ABS8UBR9_9GAMM|nr:hypothetical protein [Luteimonas fraxinea]MCD9096176.1 hypothetical protein [Luteimonas fraxinea]